MNWDQMEGQWQQFKSLARHEWDRLTADDLDAISGKKDELIGKLQQRYGIQREEARKRAERWCKSQKEMKTEDTPAFR
jgi:uncharacterized protein YjbJ (UPF0337 family)